MKAYERRERGAYPFFKVASWDARIGVWKPGKVKFASEEEARAAAWAPGRYRVTRFDDGSNHDLEPFAVPA